MLLADLCFGVVVGTGICERDLEIGVFDFAVGHYLQVLENLHVALVGVEDYIEVFVGAEHLGQHVAERFLKHADHRGLVDVFQFFKFGELLDHIRGFLFFCHCYIVRCIFRISSRISRICSRWS